MTEKEKILNCVITKGEIGKHTEATARASGCAIGIIELNNSSSSRSKVGPAGTGSTVEETVVKYDPIPCKNDGGD